MRRPRVALAVLAALAREALLVRPGEGLDGLRLSQRLPLTEPLSSRTRQIERVALCAGRRDDNHRQSARTC